MLLRLLDIHWILTMLFSGHELVGIVAYLDFSKLLTLLCLICCCVHGVSEWILKLVRQCMLVQAHIVRCGIVWLILRIQNLLRIVKADVLELLVFLQWVWLGHILSIQNMLTDSVWSRLICHLICTHFRLTVIALIVWIDVLQVNCIWIHSRWHSLIYCFIRFCFWILRIIWISNWCFRLVFRLIWLHLF